MKTITNQSGFSVNSEVGLSLIFHSMISKVTLFSKRLYQFVLILVLVLFSTIVYGTNFTSNGNGNWTTGSNWTSGTAPSLTNQNWGTVDVNHNLDIIGNYNVPNSTVNINAGKTLNISGDLTLGVGGGGNTINVYGTLHVSGNVFLTSDLKIFPGGKVIVDGNLTVKSSNYLTVGTSATPPAYSELVVKQNLISDTSGDVVVNKNGRVAVFGNFTNNTSGGSNLTINNGGQVYIEGNINLTSGGNTISSSATSPYGLYVNGTISNPSSTTTSNIKDKNYMQTNDAPFYSWVTSQSTAMPVTLLFFQVSNVSSNSISLKWATSSELNFDYFTIEHSTDGESFTTIAKVAGHGTSHERNDYVFHDMNPKIGRNYFRLKSVDFDGYTETFKVIVADVASEKDFSVSPNPSNGSYINLNVNFIPEGESRVIIYDSNGKVVGKLSDLSDTKTIEFESTLEGGVYYAKFLTIEFSKVVRFIVE